MSVFTDFRADFLRLTAEIVWCSLTTLDRHNRPRSRIIHPIWEVLSDQPVGWLATRRSPIKASHLAHSPHVSCTYWRPSHDAVLLQCVATWEHDSDEKWRIWEWFKATPPPLGYDPRTIWSAGPDDPDYSLLKLEAWRVQIVTLETLTQRQPRVWTAPPRLPQKDAALGQAPGPAAASPSGAGVARHT